MIRTIIILLALLICGCRSAPPEDISSRDRIFSLTKPNKETLKNASRDFISKICRNSGDMYDCAEQFLMTDNYQDWIYRKYMSSQQIADILYFYYKNELAMELTKSKALSYQKLLVKYYYPDGTAGMTDRDMMSVAAKRLTCNFRDLYGAGKKHSKEALVDFKTTEELSDGRTLSMYSVRWGNSKDRNVYNTIFKKKSIGGSEILLPVRHSEIGKAEK